MNIYTKVRRILVWVCVFVFAGCSPSRKVEKAINILNNNPDKASSYCATRFPLKDTVIYRDSIKYDTIFALTPVQVDTIFKKDTTIITITSPTKTIVKTVTQYKEVIKEPTAKIEEQRQLYLACEKRYQELYIKYEGEEVAKKAWKERFWWILIVAAALLGFTIRKPIAKLIGL